MKSRQLSVAKAVLGHKGGCSHNVSVELRDHQPICGDKNSEEVLDISFYIMFFRLVHV